MSKTYQDWLKNENAKDKREARRSICRDDIECWGIDYMLYIRGTPINDIYKRLCDFTVFPWNGDYANMMNAIRDEHDYKGIQDVDGFLLVFRCSLILYEQYKLKRFRNKYSLNDIRQGILSHKDEDFGEIYDFVYENVTRDILNNIRKREQKLNNEELRAMMWRYEGEYEDKYDDY